MRNVVIIGTGGHAKVISDIILRSGDNIVGFLTAEEGKKEFIGKPVLGNNADYEKYGGNEFIIAIGDADVRERIAGRMTGVKWYTAIHPVATVSNLNTVIGQGSVVMAGAVVNPFAKIGEHCIINTGAVVEHDNMIEDFSHISVGARLAGNVKIGKKSWIGAGAVISNGLWVCENSTVGAGAVVVRNIDSPGTYVGVPAKRIK